VTPEDFMAAHIDDYTAHAEHYPYSLPTNALVFPTIGQLKRAVTDSGSHFFSPDAVRFWRSRVGATLYDGRFFITSESTNPRHTARAYRVRWVNHYSDATCLMVNEFKDRFATGAEAARFARQAVAVLPIRDGNR
jgi:hypothetical protein